MLLSFVKLRLKEKTYLEHLIQNMAKFPIPYFIKEIRLMLFFEQHRIIRRHCDIVKQLTKQNYFYNKLVEAIFF